MSEKSRVESRDLRETAAKSSPAPSRANADSSTLNSQPSSLNSPEVILFTDGACRGNPGPGGWAYILRHVATGAEREAAGGEKLTTNNQMELQGLIHGLLALTRPTKVEVVTDSTYVAKGSHEWLPGWKRNGWRRREGKSWKPVKNEHLWRQLDELLARHQVTFQVVKGHSGHAENERCDELAVAAALAAAQG